MSGRQKAMGVFIVMFAISDILMACYIIRIIVLLVSIDWPVLMTAGTGIAVILPLNRRHKRRIDRMHHTGL